MLPIEQTQQYFQSYRWEGKHYLFGYPADTHPDFKWIRILESRFEYVKDNPSLLQTDAPLYLMREMIKWGGSKRRGISPKFDDYIGSYCLSTKLLKVINSLDNVSNAIASALDIPGLGPTYATKLLRFLMPRSYGALDDQIKKVLLNEIKQKVKEVNGAVSKTTDQYVAYITLLKEHREQLYNKYGKTWLIADIEMALFQWAVESNKNSIK